MWKVNGMICVSADVSGKIFVFVCVRWIQSWHRLHHSTWDFMKSVIPESGTENNARERKTETSIWFLRSAAGDVILTLCNFTIRNTLSYSRRPRTLMIRELQKPLQMTYRLYIYIYISQKHEYVIRLCARALLQDFKLVFFSLSSFSSRSSRGNSRVHVNEGKAAEVNVHFIPFVVQIRFIFRRLHHYCWWSKTSLDSTCTHGLMYDKAVLWRFPKLQHAKDFRGCVELAVAGKPRSQRAARKRSRAVFCRVRLCRERGRAYDA